MVLSRLSSNMKRQLFSGMMTALQTSICNALLHVRLDCAVGVEPRYHNRATNPFGISLAFDVALQM